MKGRRIVIRPRAERDVDEHAGAIAEASVGSALRFYGATEIAFMRLASLPRLGTSRTYRRVKLVGLRMWPIPGFKKYLIFYRPGRNGIEVVRVLHGAMDLPRELRSEALESADARGRSDNPRKIKRPRSA